MKKIKTHRGFSVIEFKDMYDNECSIQDSSLAADRCIWLGVNKPTLRILASKVRKGDTGWVDYPIPEDVSIYSRMHLNREMATKLIEVLQRFVETGNIRG